MSPESGLYLFISIDITGSTAFKNSFRVQDRLELEHPWSSVFKTFYDEFIKLFNDTLQERVDLSNEENLWKSIGDEIVIKKKLTSLSDVPYILSKCIIAMKEYRQTYFADLNLDLKGAAWLAGFPVINTEIVSGKKRDYIGPSIDTGFRLAKKFPTTTKFVISVDIAYAIGETHQARYPLEVYYEGEFILKGVLNNRPYPVFYIYVSNKIENSRMRLLNRKKLDYAELSAFCKEYIESLGEPFQLVVPYIVTENGAIEGGVIPPEHLRLLSPVQESKIDLLQDKTLEELTPKQREVLSGEIKTIRGQVGLDSTGAVEERYERSV